MILRLVVLGALGARAFAPPRPRALKSQLFAGGFVLGPPQDAPSAAELSSENVYRIVKEECSDADVNALVWKCLGYLEGPDGAWDTAKVFPKWLAKYPAPPDVVGVSRTYSKDIDEAVLRANQALVNSIPMAHKRGIREHLDPLGFTGLPLEGLTPNKTRRAQCANWLLYYRDKLWGLSLEELQAQKKIDVDRENAIARAEGKSLKVATAPPAAPTP